MIRLDETRATHPRSPPQPGNFVEVRGRRWLVEKVEDGQPSIVSLSCIDDDAQGDELRVIWEVELDARLLDGDPWSYLARDGATRNLTSSYLYYHDVFEEDPDAAGPWTGAAVAAMEIGVETVT